MQDPQLITRVYRLEQDVAVLRSERLPLDASNGLPVKLRKIAGFVVSYWALLSFLGVLSTALYVKFAFGIDYFENYRNAQTNKHLSEFHRQLGDSLMAQTEFVAAQNAYEKALEINPHNTKASYGLVKSEVFDPLEGQKYATPEVVDAKIRYLRQLFPNDYEVDFLMAYRYLEQRDFKSAKLWLEKSTEKNAQFDGAYLMLGYIAQNESDIEGAITNFVKALEINSNNGMAHNNLGFSYLINLNYQQAIEHLEKSYSISSHLLTVINLGDAYRYSGDPSTGLNWHKLALDITNDPGSENERFTGGVWTYNFMPVYSGDKDTIKSYVYASTMSQKKAIIYYALSLDYALLGRFDEAENAFNEARKLDSSHWYDEFFINKSLSTERLLDIHGTVQEWLLQHREQLELN